MSNSISVIGNSMLSSLIGIAHARKKSEARNIRKFAPERKPRSLSNRKNQKIPERLRRPLRGGGNNWVLQAITKFALRGSYFKVASCWPSSTAASPNEITSKGRVLTRHSAGQQNQPAFYRVKLGNYGEEVPKLFEELRKILSDFKDEQHEPKKLLKSLKNTRKKTTRVMHKLDCLDIIGSRDVHDYKCRVQKAALAIYNIAKTIDDTKEKHIEALVSDFLEKIGDETSSRSLIEKQLARPKELLSIDLTEIMLRSKALVNVPLKEERSVKQRPQGQFRSNRGGLVF